MTKCYRHLLMAYIHVSIILKMIMLLFSTIRNQRGKYNIRFFLHCWHWLLSFFISNKNPAFLSVFRYHDNFKVTFLQERKVRDIYIVWIRWLRGSRKHLQIWIYDGQIIKCDLKPVSCSIWFFIIYYLYLYLTLNWGTVHHIIVIWSFSFFYLE